MKKNNKKCEQCGHEFTATGCCGTVKCPKCKSEKVYNFIKVNCC